LIISKNTYEDSLALGLMMGMLKSYYSNFESYFFTIVT
jgi:hypothetical protein